VENETGLAQALASWAKRSESRDRLAAMIALAETEEGVVQRADDFDKGEWLLNVANGSINLRSGELQPHDRGDLITQLSPVAYDPNASCPLWDAFLARVLPDQEVRDYVRRAAGYTLTGAIQEHILLFCFGAGRNGKSTFISVLETILGDYATKVRAETLMLDRYGPDRGATPELVDLRGRRLLTVTELNEGQRLNEALVKDLTGGDRIRARALYQAPITFPPTHKSWMVGNHRPRVIGVDEGIWSRLRLVPFVVQIPLAERDLRLLEKLKAELPGILNWALSGCAEWLREGLQDPPSVFAATDAYRKSEDTLGQFLEDVCLLDAAAVVTGKALFAAYSQWSADNRERPMNNNRFAAALMERGFTRKRTRRGAVWQGIGLLTDDDAPDPGTDSGDGAGDKNEPSGDGTWEKNVTTSADDSTDSNDIKTGGDGTGDAPRDRGDGMTDNSENFLGKFLAYRNLQGNDVTAVTAVTEEVIPHDPLEEFADLFALLDAGQLPADVFVTIRGERVLKGAAASVRMWRYILEAAARGDKSARAELKDVSAWLQEVREQVQ
jgi:putative DNA primase/helicase